MKLKPFSLQALICSAVVGLCGVGTASAAPEAKSKVGKAAAAKKVAKPAEYVPAPATPEQVEAAERVYYGVYECEFNQTVDIERNAKYGAYVNVRHGKSSWVMKPVVSATGAIRLEDVRDETLMVQIASKSMLLNVKTGHRIVDACVSAKQRELMEAAKGEKVSAPLLETATPGK